MLEIRILRVRAEKNELGGTNIIIDYRATHGDFKYKDSYSSPVYRFYKPSDQKQEALRSIVLDVSYRYREWLREEQMSRDLLAKYPYFKKLKGKKIPESYWLAQELEK